MEPLAGQVVGQVAHGLETALVVFARVGACAMVMPGIGSARVLPRARLLLTLALSVTLAPLVAPMVGPLTGTPIRLAGMLATESAIGLLLGLLARIHLAALRFALGVAANVIGFAPLGGIAAEDGAPDGPLATLVGLGAVMALLAAGGHHMILRALLDTYAVHPPGSMPDADASLAALAAALAAAYSLALAVSGPIVVYGVLMQLAIGLVNKLAPVVPLYFVAIPFMIAGGLLIAASTVPEVLLAHLDGLSRTVLGP